MWHPTPSFYRYLPYVTSIDSRQTMRTHTPKILASLERLRKLKEELPRLGSRVIAANRDMSPIDMVIVGIVKRCLSTTAALNLLVLSWNMTCARAVLRMQLDTVLRLSAFWLSDGPQEMAEEVISGKPINKMKDRDGQRMTDSYLARKLGDHFDWVPRVYEYTSGYIHFSERHLFDPIWNLDDKERIATFVVNEYDDKFPESSWVEVIDRACDCLLIVKYLLEGYERTKVAAANKALERTQ